MLELLLQDDLENFGDIGSLEDNVESFLSHDGGDGNIYGTLKQSLTEHKPEPKGNYQALLIYMIDCLYGHLLTLRIHLRVFLWGSWLYSNKK